MTLPRGDGDPPTDPTDPSAPSGDPASGSPGAGPSPDDAFPDPSDAAASDAVTERWSPSGDADLPVQPLAPPMTPTPPESAGTGTADGPSTAVGVPGSQAGAPPDADDRSEQPSPLISWAPSGGVPADAAHPDGSASGPPLVGWQVPAQRTVETAEGYGLAGIGARVVAYFIDGILVSIVPALLAVVLVDYGPLVRDAIDQAMTQAETGAPMVAAPMPLTPELVLTTLISTAISYLYFVGFWTSGGQATPGMRGLRMRVVDVVGSQTLSLTQATKRWIALGAPIGLLGLIGPLQSVAGLVSLGLSLLLLITAATDDRKQGLHDRWAQSVVIRSRTSRDGATAVGCIVLVLLAIGFGVLLGTIAAGAVLPEMLDAFEQGRFTP